MKLGTVAMLGLPVLARGKRDGSVVARQRVRRLVDRYPSRPDWWRWVPFSDETERGGE